MKALSVKQPWVWAIANGFKPIETRTWATRYRGELLLVASKTPDQTMLDYLTKQFGDVLLKELEYSKAIVVVRLVDCRPMTKADESAAMCNIYKGAYSWVLKDIQKIEPFPVKGQLGLYEVDYEREKAVSK